MANMRLFPADSEWAAKTSASLQSTLWEFRQAVRIPSVVSMPAMLCQISVR